MRMPLMATVMAAVLAAAALSCAGHAQAGMPKSEADFIAAIGDARTVYDAQPTSAKKSALVKEMLGRWKDILPGGVIQGWTGTLVELGTTAGGRFHLAVRIADRINLLTWRTPFTDLSHGTLIGVKSPLYPTLCGMKAGDTVRFDGKYQSLVNLKEREKVFDTDLIVAFSAIAPAQ